MTTIAVIGPGDIADERITAAAYDVGRCVAGHAAILVCGGLGGVMAAACRGAKEHGGRTVGLLPGPDRAEANGYVDVAVATGLGQGRNVLVVRTADAVVAVGGSWGTLSEIGLACRAGKPVVALHGWRISDSAGTPVPGPALAENADEAAAYAFRALGDPANSPPNAAPGEAARHPAGESSTPGSAP